MRSQSFKCAKCGSRVNADTNLLLLSDGSPVCGNCSYHCSVCKQPIVDEAIMTGDDSYHAHCFTCRQCKRGIKELVFAKTSQGIYCMGCHNERAARSRRHHEKKKRARAKLEEEERREMANLNAGRTGVDPSPDTTPTNGQYTGTETILAEPTSGRNGASGRDRLPTTPASRSQTVPVLGVDSMIAPPQRSSSMEEPSKEFGSLNVPTSKSAKRRSINPGLRLADSNGLVPNSSQQLSPTQSDLYSPAFSSESAVPSPGLVTTGTVAAQAPSHSVSSTLSKELPEKSRTTDWNSSAHDSYPQLNGHAVDPPHSAGLKERSRSNTPVPSNVDASGRASDESDNDEAPLVPPKATVNGSIDGETKSALPPIELTFHDDPEFSSLLTSFGGDANPPPLTLRDPAGSRRSMQALANVALRISDDPVIPDARSSSATIVPEIMAEDAKDNHSQPVEFPEPPKTSFDGARYSSETSRTTRSSSESRNAASSTAHSTRPTGPRQRLDSNNSVASSVNRPMPQRADTGDLVARTLKEALKDANERGANAVKLDKDFIEAIIRALQGSQTRFADMKGRLDSMKRVSQRMFDGLSVAQEEYDQEVALRRDAEAEVTRLRLQLSAQNAQLTALTADQRKQELMQKMSRDMSENLHGLEKHLSQLKVERDLTLAEMEELSQTKGKQDPSEATSLSRSLTSRFDNLKVKYRRDLEPLIAEREALEREINELKQAKELCLEETTSLTSRNEELSELNMAMTRQLENLQTTIKARSADRKASKPTPLPTLPSGTPQITPVSSTSTTSSAASLTSTSTYVEEERKGAKSDSEASNTLRKFPWFKGKDPNSIGRDIASQLSKLQQSLPGPPLPEKTKPVVRHNFQQQSVLRFARCDYCGDKMWGTQLRCANCSTACHTRCLALINTPCREASAPAQEEKDVVDISPPPPSMFGRSLIEQTQSDANASKSDNRFVPVIVEKCIQAVETRGLEYEGIYRKTGGAGQSKAITQAFERGDYDAIDLLDPDNFTDISSVTSVLKNYFRSLPNPLLTFELHDAFIQAATYRDAASKSSALQAVLEQLPNEHFHTLRLLMLHLHGVMEYSHINLMSARNLGVVFGPTLMRSADSSKEFADMAGKALCIEWLVENAQTWANSRPR
ncbi:SubName: Full=Uncharacterized protein {ECO:0000313/EMBL:CCA68331.1} [Serendipita indica DSM 11827]|uniref:GTPase-activating protein beta-chimerin n=1 Tax=Serendipita indica (strain DSM 11827) TaxID=1109443 RepID=G4TAJ7_SERID|nr:SubName: Full=Uncharacterized protein {ECO:0000313/EMBL:CCA68331.1} [Serendipita indica DSM 11827]CCA68331.1 hypothetical protein PIIN_11679 [Serendipita indica DSM 11827]